MPLHPSPSLPLSFPFSLPLPLTPPSLPPFLFPSLSLSLFPYLPLSISPSFPLPSDIQKIEEGIGDKLSIVIQLFTTFIAGFVVGFIQEWRLTLVLAGVTPLLVLAAAVVGKVR